MTHGMGKNFSGLRDNNSIYFGDGITDHGDSAGLAKGFTSYGYEPAYQTEPHSYHYVLHACDCHPNEPIVNCIKRRTKYDCL